MQIEKNCNWLVLTLKMIFPAAVGSGASAHQAFFLDWAGYGWRTKRLIADSHQGRPQTKETQRQGDTDDRGPGRSHRAKTATTDCNCLAMTKRTSQPGQDCQTAKEGQKEGQLQNKQTIIKLHSPHMQMQMELAA